MVTCEGAAHKLKPSPSDRSPLVWRHLEYQVALAAEKAAEEKRKRDEEEAVWVAIEKARAAVERATSGWGPGCYHCVHLKARCSLVHEQPTGSGAWDVSATDGLSRLDNTLGQIAEGIEAQNELLQRSNKVQVVVANELHGLHSEFWKFLAEFGRYIYEEPQAGSSKDAGSDEDGVPTEVVELPQEMCEGYAYMYHDQAVKY
ncbi:hypothetical protein BU17DRAFT_80596 [Hysterangium stoloniferum]|nr:hypothetical protein BU17DRAFT_80596 [Hysterangium stoloniferum]